MAKDGLTLPEAICFLGWRQPPSDTANWLATTTLADILAAIEPHGLHPHASTSLSPAAADLQQSLAQYGTQTGFLRRFS